MHIADGVLSGPVLATTGALAAAGVAAGLRKMDWERVPRVGVLASVFFVASLIHVPIGPASAHLVMNGLMGLLLGWAALPALAAALLLQAILFGFGGFTALGANVFNMGLPALLCHYFFARPIRSSTSPRRVFALAFLAGMAGLLFASTLVALSLYASGKAFLAVALVIFAGNMPVMVIEGFVTGAAVMFLHKVRPALIRPPVCSKAEGGRP